MRTGSVLEDVSKCSRVRPAAARLRSVGAAKSDKRICFGSDACYLQSSASKLLKETCSYIKSLHREVDDLSDRLSELMSTMDNDSPQAEIIRSLLR
jgi:hypothetical protein